MSSNLLEIPPFPGSSNLLPTAGLIAQPAALLGKNGLQNLPAGADFAALIESFLGGAPSLESAPQDDFPELPEKVLAGIKQLLAKSDLTILDPSPSAPSQPLTVLKAQVKKDSDASATDTPGAALAFFLVPAPPAPSGAAGSENKSDLGEPQSALSIGPEEQAGQTTSDSPKAGSIPLEVLISKETQGIALKVLREPVTSPFQLALSVPTLNLQEGGNESVYAPGPSIQATSLPPETSGWLEIPAEVLSVLKGFDEAQKDTQAPIETEVSQTLIAPSALSIPPAPGSSSPGNPTAPASSMSRTATGLQVTLPESLAQQVQSLLSEWKPASAPTGSEASPPTGSPASQEKQLSASPAPVVRLLIGEIVEHLQALQGEILSVTRPKGIEATPVQSIIPEVPVGSSLPAPVASGVKAAAEPADIQPTPATLPSSGNLENLPPATVTAGTAGALSASSEGGLSSPSVPAVPEKGEPLEVLKQATTAKAASNAPASQGPQPIPQPGEKSSIGARETKPALNLAFQALLPQTEPHRTTAAVQNNQGGNSLAALPVLTTGVGGQGTSQANGEPGQFALKAAPTIVPEAAPTGSTGNELPETAPSQRAAVGSKAVPLANPVAVTPLQLAPAALVQDEPLQPLKQVSTVGPAAQAPPTQTGPGPIPPADDVSGINRPEAKSSSPGSPPAPALAALAEEEDAAKRFGIVQVISRDASSIRPDSHYAPAVAGPAETQAKEPVSRTTPLTHDPRGAAEARVLDQISQAIRVQGGNSGSEMKIRLVPENLGEVHLKISVRDNVVVAELRAGTEGTREVLSKHTQQIQNVLQEAGYRVDQIAVRGGASDSVADWRGGPQRDPLQQQNQPHEQAPRERGNRQPPGQQQSDERKRPAWGQWDRYA
jgi:flagellar hook-length control protein FliK